MATLSIATENFALFAPAVKAFTHAYAAQFSVGATNIFDCMKSPTVELELVVSEGILEPAGSVRISALKALVDIIQMHKPQRDTDFPIADSNYTTQEARVIALSACRRLTRYRGATESRGSHITVLKFKAGWFDTDCQFQPSHALTTTQQLIAKAGLQAILLLS